MEANYKEVLRYLGYGKETPSDAILALIDWAILELSLWVNPGYVHKVWDTIITEEVVTLGVMTIHSRDLAKNLQDCQRATLFAATLGAGPDLLIKRFSRLDMSRTVILQATASAMMEDYCDACQGALATSLLEEGQCFRPRFSPGYGDFNLSYQPKIISLLDSPRRIGLTVTESFLLAPMKSVTAIIGIGDGIRIPHQKNCTLCSKKDCTYRRSDYL